MCTVDSYHAVRTSGDMPDGLETSFLSTTQSGGRITAGNTATLTLAGMEGTIIRSVALFMRSNKTAGAGSFHMYTDEREVATIADAPFSASSWNGAYCSDSLVRIEVPMSAFKLNSELTMQITASANSLYIGRYEINYTKSANPLGVVSFVSGTSQVFPSQQETFRGAGVWLPTADAPGAEWHFLGWTTEPVVSTTSCPEYFPAESRYYPSGAVTLYALYRQGDAPGDLYSTENLTSGTYALVNYDYTCLMMGPVVSHHVGARNVSINRVMDAPICVIPGETVSADCRYILSVTDDGVTLQHELSGQYVGFSSGSSPSLRVAESLWTVYPGAESSFMFCHGITADNIAYCLQPTLLQSDTTCFSDIRLQLSPNGMYMMLFPLPEILPAPILYSTSPLGESLEEKTIESIRIEGGMIFNPNKQLISLYDCVGQVVTHSCADISLSELPAGIYIVKSFGLTYRIVH